MRNSIEVCRLGRMEYARALALQNELQSSLIAAKRSGGVPNHIMLVVEHPPVYTIGKSGDASNLLASEQVLRSIGAEFVHIDRGGDITFHGPGQLVVYPILDLEQIYTDLGKYLRTLEGIIIDTIAKYDIVGTRSAGRTGVWIDDASGEQPVKKICAMGIHCSRWVTKHGLALNVGTELSFFDRIIPCGIEGAYVTSMEAECGKSVDADEVSGLVVAEFAAAFDLETKVRIGPDAHRYLNELCTVSGVHDA